jgi:16S rRNA (guanine527-N7)-methyltransferase
VKRAPGPGWPADEVEAAGRGVLGRPLERAEHEALRRYAETLLAWNRGHRMVGPATLAGIARDLIVDSLLFRPLLPSGTIRVLDLGAGAGLPGIPLSITLPEMTVVLLEARRKRVSFLLTVIRELGLGRVEVVHDRAEVALASRPDLAAAFDAVLARCVARPEVLGGLAHPFIRPGGMLVMSAAPAARPSATSDLGFTAAEVRQVDIRPLGIHRRFLVGRKTRD